LTASPDPGLLGVILRLATALRQRESMGSDRSLSVPGAAVFVIASKHDDGKLSSARLYVEKDGIKPPI